MTGFHFGRVKVNCEAREGALGCVVGDVTFDGLVAMPKLLFAGLQELFDLA